MKQYRFSSAMSRKSVSLFTWVSLILSFPLIFSSQTEPTCIGFRASCPDSKSVCFSSVQSDLRAQTTNSKSDQSESTFQLSNGRSVTCSSVQSIGLHEPGLGKNNENDDSKIVACKEPLIPDNWMKASNGVIEVLKEDETGQAGQGFGSESDFLAVNLEINPTVLDWGESGLYSANFKTLNLRNLHDESVLQIYEPFSSDPQFYVHEFQNPKFEGVLVKPGENFSISFVFLPRNLGENLAQFVIQTNFGGFILQAKGLAIESIYKIKPLIGLELQIGAILSKNLTFHNPFDGTLHVEEMAVWISASESAHQSNHAICKLDKERNSNTSLYNEWFGLNNGFGLVEMDLKPGKKWKVLPNKNGRIVELKLQGRMEGKVFGAICVKLQNGTDKRSITIVVPFELEVHKNTNPNPSLNDLGFQPVSLSVERHLACDRTGTGTVFSLHLKNEGPSLLTVMNIFEERESEKLFEILFVKKLLIFPQTDTIVGLVKLEDCYSAISTVELVELLQLQCNLVAELNSSVNPIVKIPCGDLIGSNLSQKDNKEEGLSANEESLGAYLQDSVENTKIGELREIEASDLLISNWISHATKTEYSVLPKNELIFPPVQIGSVISKRIPVKNPSPNPVLVQLILNSEQLITHCKSSDESSDRTFTPNTPKNSLIKTGFSIPNPGLTEVLLNPFESKFLGPINFHPSKRCNWSSSALIRSNLSGVESVFLHGSGGAHSISILLEGSKPVWMLDFDPFGTETSIANLDKNLSALQNPKPCPSCDFQFSKDLYAKNTGELPFEVRKIRVSGTDCNSDGFSVRNCNGFLLNPNETVPIFVSYRPDFQTGTVKRDLELDLARGVLVIPMKVNIPFCMMNQCRKVSVFWRVSLCILILTGVILSVFAFVGFDFVTNFGAKNCYSRLDGEINSNNNGNKKNNNKSGKKPLLHHANKNSRPAQQKQSFINTFHSLPQPKRVAERVIAQPATPTAAPPSPAPDPDPPQSDLTVKVGKEKSAKRKSNRRRAVNNGNKLEASSSLSGKSSSSPSSPVSSGSFTPKETLVSPFCENSVKKGETLISPFCENAVRKVETLNNPFCATNVKKETLNNPFCETVVKKEKVVETLSPKPETLNPFCSTVVNKEKVVETLNPFYSTPVKNEKIVEKKKDQIAKWSFEKDKIAEWSPENSPVYSGVRVESPTFFSRAPGPNKGKKREDYFAIREKREGVFAILEKKEQLTYDIWGDHFAERWASYCNEGPDGKCSTSFFAVEPLSPNSLLNINNSAHYAIALANANGNGNETEIVNGNGTENVNENGNGNGNENENGKENGDDVVIGESEMN